MKSFVSTIKHSLKPSLKPSSKPSSILKISLKDANREKEIREIRKVESNLIQERLHQGEDALNKMLERLYDFLQITNLVNDMPPFKFQCNDIEKYLKFIYDLKVINKYSVNNRKSIYYAETLFPDILKEVDTYLQRVLKPRVQRYSDDTIGDIIKHVGLMCYLELIEAHIKVKQSNTELFCKRSYAGGTSAFVKALKNPFFLKDKEKKTIEINFETFKKINGTDCRENWISIYKTLCEESKEKLQKKLEKEKSTNPGTNRQDVFKIIPELQGKIDQLEAWVRSLRLENKNLTQYIAELESKFSPQPQQQLQSEARQSIIGGPLKGFGQYTPIPAYPYCIYPTNVPNYFPPEILSKPETIIFNETTTNYYGGISQTNPPSPILDPEDPVESNFGNPVIGDYASDLEPGFY